MAEFATRPSSSDVGEEGASPSEQLVGSPTTGDTFNTRSEGPQGAGTQQMPDTEQSSEWYEGRAAEMSQQEILDDMTNQMYSETNDMKEFGARVIKDWSNNSKGQRDTVSMVGGILGAAAGFAATRGKPGALQIGYEVGAAVPVVAAAGGSAAGTYLANTIQLVFDMGLDADEVVKEAAINATFEMGAGSLAKLMMGGYVDKGLKKLFANAEEGRKVLGQQTKTAGQVERNALREGERVGLPLSLSDLSGPGSSYKRVGGVLPLISRPFTQQAKESSRKGRVLLEGGLDDMAPWQTFTEAGANMVGSARVNYAKFGAINESYYKHFYRLADGLSDPNVVITQPLKDILKEAKALPLPTGVTAVDGNAGVEKLFQQIASTTDTTTIKQARGLKKHVSNLFDMDSTSNFQKRQLTLLSKGVEDSIGAMDVSKLAPGEADAVKTAYKKANDWFNEKIVIYKTPTAKQLQKVDKNLHQPGAIEAGSKEHDQLLDDILRMRSVESLRNLRELTALRVSRRVGDIPSTVAFNPSMKELGQKWYSESLREAITIDSRSKYVTLNIAKLRSSMMMDSNPIYMQEMFKGTGIDDKILRDTITALGHRTDPVFPAGMIERRFVLGGIDTIKSSLLSVGNVTKGAAGSAVAGDVATTGGTLTIAVAAILYNVSAFMANPKMMKAVASLVELPTTASMQNKTAALDVIAKYIAHTEQDFTKK
jgi:hypothetical protein